MKHPDKWRETVNFLELPFSRIKIIEILGYPHAGNDVIHAKVIYQESEVNAFIKAERQNGADIANEVKVISAIPLAFVPEILDYSLAEPRFIATKEAQGERLSFIAECDPDIDVNCYFSKQAAALSELHNLQIDCELVKDRKFFHKPPDDHFDKHDLSNAKAFLELSTPINASKCFIHGDFHYANILWSGGNISCVLDYELSGIGVREYDMAWAIFLRPSQKFGLSWQAVEAFLSGYKNPFDRAAFCHYYVQIASYFYAFGDEAYKGKVRELIEKAIASAQ